MKLKRLIASLLAVAAVLALTLPSFAASSFNDVHDDVTAVNADILRLMGVVTGGDGNNYYPDNNLTRAEFCAMAIRVLGRESEVPLYSARTIFTDVTSRHWAGGYVNLASSITVGGGESPSRLIAGVGDGSFRPDVPISYDQAVTILVRMLGYGDSDVGAVWPVGYLNKASSLGLSDGLTVSNTSAAITRAQAAQLFVNLLTTKTSSGSRFYETLGSVQDGVILLAVNVAANDGTPGAIRTSQGVYLPAADGAAPSALLGRRGALVLDARGRIAAFIPDDTTSVTVTLAEDAQAGYFRGTDGVRYVPAASTPVYLGSGGGSSSTYADVYLNLYAGSQVTLFLDNGSVIGISYAGSAADATSACVVTGTLNSFSFYQLTGGASGYTIRKNGQIISLSDIKQYDVATYDPGSNTVIVSDLRLTCVYENASPSPTAPTAITVLGHTFDVLPSAADTISQFKIGQTVSLLLTADGKVAGMAAVTGQTAGTAIGLAGSDSVDVALPNGSTIRLSGDVPASVQGRLVTVSAVKGDKLAATSLTLQSPTGSFDINAMTLGQYTVAPGVRLYEEADASTLKPVSLAGLELSVVARNQIVSFHRNSTGQVDIIVIKPITGDTYTYGILKKSTAVYSGGELTATNPAVSVINGSGGLEPVICTMSFQDGAFGGVVASAHQVNGIPVAAALVELTGISGVSRSDFFQIDGLWYVTAHGAVYRVADDVQGYIKTTGKWFEQDAASRLSAIRAYSDDMTIFVDPLGNKVRIIQAN